mgnify:CR=1 FL=1
MRPIVIAANTSWYINHYRSSLIDEIKKKWGHPISLSPIDSASTDLEEKTFYIPWNTSRKDDTKLISLIIALIKIIFLVRAIKPALIHSHTLKANLLISIASAFFGIKTVLSFAGLGKFSDSKGLKKTFFISILKIIIFISKIERINRWKWRINEKRTIFIFQNPRDKKLVEKLFNNSLKQNIILIPGSGIPSRYFTNKSDKVNKKRSHNFIYCGRLLKSKGIETFIKLAELNNKDQFHVFGEFDLSRKDSLRKVDFIKFNTLSNLHFHGNKKDPLINKKLINKVLIVPSEYGEGLPRSIGEALALNINVIASQKSCCETFNKKMLYVVQRNSINEYMKVIQLYKKEFISEECIFKKKEGYNFAKKYLYEKEIVSQTTKIYKNLMKQY